MPSPVLFYHIWKRKERIDMATEVLMPKLGLTMTEGTIEEWKIKEGQAVKKGDILISGVVEVTGDFDAPLSTHLVYADGDVVLTGSQNYHSVLEMEYQEKVYTGKERKRISLRGFGYQVDFFTWES